VLTEVGREGMLPPSAAPADLKDAVDKLVLFAAGIRASQCFALPFRRYLRGDTLQNSGYRVELILSSQHRI